MKLHVVDTPGFNDTDGFNQDACNLWGIRKFCQERITTGSIFYDNIILFCMKTTENRFEGPESKFSKMLRILKDLKVIDPVHANNNLIVVLTFACAIPPKDLREKAMKIRNVLKAKKSLFREPPVVFIENDFTGHALRTNKNNSGGTILPDGTIQPLNLFHAMMDLMRRNHDELGYITIREFYKRSWRTKHAFTKSREVTGRRVTNLSSLSEEELACRGALLNDDEQWQELMKKLEQASHF